MPSSPISDGRTQAASSSRPRTSSLTHRMGATATPAPVRVRGGAGSAGGIAGGGSSKNGREAMAFTVPWTAHGHLGGGSESAVRAVTSGRGCGLCPVVGSAGQPGRTATPHHWSRGRGTGSACLSCRTSAINARQRISSDALQEVAMSERAKTIDTLLDERRTFAPSAEFLSKARVTAQSLFEAAEADTEGFWAEQARKYVSWYKPFDTVLEWDLPFAKWFVGGELNVSYNCLDRHVEAGRGEKVAYHFEGEQGDTRAITYAELLSGVCRLANALKKLGIKRGDRVGIYMPMIPELPMAMLACARIGAAHSVVFGGFSAEAVRDRMNDAAAVAIITADEGWRRGGLVPLKRSVDEACEGAPTVKNVVVVRRTGNEVPMVEGRDPWYHDLVEGEPDTWEPEHMESEDLLFTLYTSGTTAKPKGIKNTTAGYLLYAMFTHDLVFDIQPDTVYWCAADVGWVTGHSYIVYAPLGNGVTSVMYEGTPDYPNKDRWGSIIEKSGESVLYCAPTAIRTFMNWGPEFPQAHDLSSLRLLGTVA